MLSRFDSIPKSEMFFKIAVLKIWTILRSMSTVKSFILEMLMFFHES